MGNPEYFKNLDGVMPLYEYECSNCKFYVEALQKISDPPLLKCPSCGKDALQRLVSAPNFRLKGSGWYETDFKSEKEAKRNIAAGDDKPAESKEDDTSKTKRPVRASSSNRSQKGSLFARKTSGKTAGKSKSSSKKKAKKAVKKGTKGKAGKSAKKKSAKKASRKK